MSDEIEFLCGVFFIFLAIVIIAAICSRDRSNDGYAEGFQDAQAVDVAFSLMDIGLKLCMSGKSSREKRCTGGAKSSSSSSTHASTSHGGTKRR